MAIKDIPGIGWTVIIILGMLMIWGVLKHYTGMSGFPDELRQAVAEWISGKEKP